MRQVQLIAVPLVEHELGDQRILGCTGIPFFRLDPEQHAKGECHFLGLSLYWVGEIFGQPKYTTDTHICVSQWYSSPHRNVRIIDICQRNKKTAPKGGLTFRQQ